MPKQVNIKSVLDILELAGIVIGRTEFFLLNRRADRDMVEREAPGTTFKLRRCCSENAFDASSMDVRGLGFVIYITPWAKEPEESLAHELLHLEAFRNEIPNGEQEEWVNRMEAKCYKVYLDLAGQSLSPEDIKTIKAKIRFLRANAKAAKDAQRLKSSRR